MNYFDAIARQNPTAQISVQGDPNIYENIISEDGTPLPVKSDLDTIIIKYTQDDKWNDVKLYRDDRTTNGGYKVSTSTTVTVAATATTPATTTKTTVPSWFHSDQASRTQQIALVILGANLPAGIMWKTMAGTFVPMSAALAGAIFQTAVGSDQRIFGVAENHRQGIFATTTSAAAASYNYFPGWPQSYQEFAAAAPLPPVPVSSFTADVTTGPAPLAVTVTDTSTNSPTALTWNFGDGATATVPSLTHTYTTAGTYTLVHSATNAGGTSTLTITGYIVVT
jgi:PKD repeat protein